MLYASSEAREDIQNMTHHSQPSAGNPAEVGNPQADSAAPQAEGVFLRVCRRDERAASLQLLVKAKVNRTRLVGIARSAIPTLAEAHEGHGDRIAFVVPHERTGSQRKWALGWLTHWLRKGRSAKRLAEVYTEAVKSFGAKYAADGYRAGECHAVALRGHLQQRAKDLPGYDLLHFEANPARFAKTASQIEEAAMREEHRRLYRLDREILRGAVAVDSEPETSPWEDELADMNAESAACAMDYRNARSESDSWQRDLGNA